MRRQWLAAWLALVWLGTQPAWAQFKTPGDDPKGTRLADAQVQVWQFGVTVTAASGPCTGLVGYVPLPTQWPEQEVAVLREEISPLAKVRFQTLEGNVRLMIVDIPRLAPGEEAKALLTYEVRRHATQTPEKTDLYALADPKKLPRDVRPFLASSPLIEVKSPKVRAALKEIDYKEKKNAWEQIEAIYDWVRGKVTFKRGPVKGAVAVLRDGEGDAEDSVSLFIALCRTADIPARTVWVPGHCYAEFYLVDDEDKGHWFPCELTGNRNFGGINEHRPVIEKGDSFRASL